ncbi:geranylgeranyl transferase type-1 subunit beta-like [Tubulanus polymorphus]|uniref:geranylgeranyl transferase type-1 subunit beta-like n=1 Tax=Tubulanus polymorphus TaxID=672921 RepID=UPI003DA284BF
MSDHDKPDLMKSKHVKFFRRTLAVLPGHMVSLDTMKMTIAFFSISGLDILGRLDELNDDKEEIIEWIYSLQVLPDEGGKNMNKCGFRASNMIGCSYEPEKTRSDQCIYDGSHIAMTYTALASLIILGDDLSRVNKPAIIQGVRSLQMSDGSFSSTMDGSETDMRFIYCAACVCYMLNDWSAIEIDKAVEYIKHSQGYEGGLGQGAGQESHGGSTFCGIASLVLMKKLDQAFTIKDLNRLKRWCILRQQTGFHSRPNKPEDTCYSFWVGATLKLLGMFEMTNYEFNRSFVLETQDEVIGGFSKWPDNTPDPLHSYMGLGGLSFLKDPEFHLNEVDPTINITLRAMDHLHQLQKQWTVAS